MHSLSSPLIFTATQVNAFFDAHRTVRHYQTQADGSPWPLPEEHLNALLHAAQRAPTDATAQLYSIIRLVNPAVRRQVAALTANAHIATASEAFILCADLHRTRRFLEVSGKTPGHWPAIAVHFGLGDAVLAGQNLLLAAELLGYRGCWIGGVMNGLLELLDLLNLPPQVLPFAALTVGLSAEETPHRPRLPRPLVVHIDQYQEAATEELAQGITVMNPIAARSDRPGDWIRLLNHYFGSGGSMEEREGVLVSALHQQHLDCLPPGPPPTIKDAG